MMKRKILSLLVPSLLVLSSAQAAEIYNKDGNKLDLYGKAVGLHYFSSDNGSDGDFSYVRFGFKGETQINGNMTGYGQWEYNIQTNNSEGSDAQNGNKTRLGFAGLRFDQYGSIDYGRNYAVAYDALSYTDMLPEFGGDYGYSDSMTGRTTGVATYRNANFFGLIEGLNVALQYQGKNERDDVQRSNGDGWGLSTSYALPYSFAITGAYQQQNRTTKQHNMDYGSGDTASVWGVGLKYDNAPVYVAVTYAEGQNATRISSDINGVSKSGFANKTQNFEAVAQYQFDFGLRPSLAFIQQKAKDVEGIGDVDLVKYIDVGASYYFNKNMSTYVDYRINQLSNNNKLGINNDNIVATGLVYQF
ncbi:porin [Rosenbergiella nectarea]|uniref:porin n=1 Tax=Rosenbergiella nectarea TaxID=988801 RepID=UPI0023DF3DBA|nr:porin [Rosenbergiella nectarea]